MQRWIALLLLALPISVRADTLIVHPDGTGDHPTIQAVVDAASDGDQILLGGAQDA